MKNLIRCIWIAVVLLTLAGCNKSFLDEQLDSNYAPQNTLTDSLGFEANITGVMSRIRAQYTSDDDQGLLGAMYLGTDMVINGQTTSGMFPYVNNEIMNSNDFCANFYWRWAYNTLNNINLLIKASEDPAVVATSAANKAYVGAEAKFYRAYVYNFLVTLWGAVPLITVPLDQPKTDFVRAPVADIDAVIIKDLKDAAAVLPLADKVRKSGRPSSGMARHLLAEVYLRTNKPDLAEAECITVINSGSYQLVKARFGVKASDPGDYFHDMFITGNQRYAQGNKESIWVVEQQLNVLGGSTGLDQHRRMWVPFYAGIPGMLIVDSLGGRGIGRFRLSNWILYNLYDQYDMRNSMHNIRRNLTYNDPAQTNFGKPLPTNNADTVWRNAPYTTKHNFFNPADLNGYQSYKDITMMRLAETYLFLAEAQFKQGRTGDAATSINELRKRAYPDYPAHGQVVASDITLDFILDERARELVSEENRRMTLLRTGTLVNRVTNYLNAYNTQAGQPVTGLDKVTLRKGLFPIPQQSIDLNTGAELKQNDGY